MKEGKEKFDELVWEKSQIQIFSENQFDVYFQIFF